MEKNSRIRHAEFKLGKVVRTCDEHSETLITGDSDVKVDVINLKLAPDEIKSLIDFKTFFPAYHMNKKYWITVLLNRDLGEEKLFSLIKKSYDIVKNKTKNSTVK